MSHLPSSEPPVRELAFKALGPDDEAVFFELYSAVRTIALRMEAWDAASRTALLRAQFDAQRRGYRQQYPGAGERLIVRDGVAIGWVIVDRSGPALHGIDIGLRPEAQGQGAGTASIRLLQQEAAAAARSMIITVQRFNERAQALYKRLGFRAMRETDLHIVMEWDRPGGQANESI